MKAMEPKTVFLCLVVMGCMPSIGYAQSLQEAIEEALIVPLATLEAQAFDYNTTPEMPEVKAARQKMDAAEEKAEAAKHEYAAYVKAFQWSSDVDDTMVKATKEKWRVASEGWLAAIDEYYAADDKARDKAKADVASAIADAKAKARPGKKRAKHCRATLKPVDDHLEIVEIVKCVQIMEAIANACSTATNQFRQDKNLKASIDTEMDSLKAYATQCVTKNIASYSALVRYIVMPEAKDQYARLIEKCRQEETNTLGVLGYEFIWPCFKGYLDMIDEPLEPPPTEISPEPAEDSETLPEVKA